MKRTGVARLPLHYGRAPRWLVARMIKLADAIVTIIIDEWSRQVLTAHFRPVLVSSVGLRFGL